MKDTHDLFMEVSAVFEGPVLLYSGGTSLSLCEKDECLDNIYSFLTKDIELVLFYKKQSNIYADDMCDFCGQYYEGVRGHRCSRCLTKVYCGVNCRDLDWKVHKLVCREGEEERKKVGREERSLTGSC